MQTEMRTRRRMAYNEFSGVRAGRILHTLLPSPRYLGEPVVSKGLCQSCHYVRAMDTAARARDVTRDAVTDIMPDRLRDVIDTRLQTVSMTPAVLTLLSAQATDRDANRAELDRRAAGVQLIYDGLKLTRTLARAPPWDQTPQKAEKADIDVLAADVLVARGFSLLARTEAAGKAVETVRAFGRDETNYSLGREHPKLDGRTLEADVFELAIIAGVSATGAELPSGIRPFAVELATSFDRSLPDVPALLSEPTADALEALIADRSPTPAVPERMWASSSATDP